MITLEFNADKQILTRTDNEKVVSNSSNVHQCHFSFSEDWDNKEITATFCRDRITVTVILDENNTCLIPSRLLKTSKDMNLEVGVFGVNEEKVITSTLVNIPVIAGSSTSGASIEISYNLFEQIMQKISEIAHAQVSPEVIEEAVEQYLTEHPIETVTEEDVERIVADYVTAHKAELKGDKGDNGDNGKSAYQIAVDNGFTGTEEQWLASLKGEKGDSGEVSSYDDTEIKQEINNMLPLIGEYLPISSSNSNKKRSVAVGATKTNFYAGGFVEKYGINSASELNFEVSAETSSGNVVAYNRVAVNWNSKTVWIYFDELTEAVTFICKCSKIQ